MRNLGRHRVQAARVINPFDLQISDLIDFDAAATRLQAAFLRLLSIINMPPQRIFDSYFGGDGWVLQVHQRTEDANVLRNTYRSRWGVGNPFAM
jgi:hypothetical protein